MSRMVQEKAGDSQIGYSLGSGVAFVQAEGSLVFAPNQMILVRIPLQIPKGSTIDSANLRTDLSVKDPDITQSSFHTVCAHASGDSEMLVPGEFVYDRARTVASVEWNPTWTAPATSDPVFSTIDVKTVIQEIVNRADYKTGGYITFMIVCTDEHGSDMSIHANNTLYPTPRLTVDFTEPISNVRYDINRFSNSEFAASLSSIEPTSPVPYWGQSDFFGTYVGAPNFGTLAVDNAFTRLPGVPTLRFTTGTPPSPNTTRTGPESAVLVDRGESWIFCGWIYISSAIPLTHSVWCELIYLSGATMVPIPERGQWVPFCTKPYAEASENVNFHWAVVGIDLGFSAGWQVWISEPTMMRSKFRQMPFTGQTSEEQFVDHRSSISKQQAVREWTPRTSMMVDGVLKRMPRWTKRTDGILQLSEPVKGGPQIGQLPAGQTVGGLPAGQTITEL